MSTRNVQKWQELGGIRCPRQKGQGGQQKEAVRTPGPPSAPQPEQIFPSLLHGRLEFSPLRNGLRKAAEQRHEEGKGDIPSS